MKSRAKPRSFGCYYVKKIPIGRKMYLDIKSMQPFEQHNSFENSDIDDDNDNNSKEEQENGLTKNS